MNRLEFEALLERPANSRYEYFIKKVVDYEEIWGLYNEGWAIAKDNEGNMLMPFFPKKEFAEYIANHEWGSYRAVSIDLYEFIESWLDGMSVDRIKPSIFPTDKDTAIVDIEVLLKDLESELENY